MRDVIDVMVEHKSDVVPGNMGEIIHGKLVRGGTCPVCALQVQATYAMAGLRPLYLMRVVHFARKYRSGGWYVRTRKVKLTEALFIIMSGKFRELLYAIRRR